MRGAGTRSGGTNLRMIVERPDAKSLRYKLEADDPSLHLMHRPFGPVKFERDPLTFFDEFKHRFAQRAGEFSLTGGDSHARDPLNDLGYELFDMLFPDDLKEKFMRIHPVIKTLMILTEEPYIPWELCKIPSIDGAGEGPFFCEAFRLTRWHPGKKSPEKQLGMKRFAVVGARYRDLPSVKKEVRAIKELAGNGRRVDEVEATAVAIKTAMGKGIYDVCHFAGHGSVEHGEPVLELNHGERFGPDRISALTMNLEAAHPLIFMNACYSGRATFSLTGIAGWAQKFIKSGAGAFIGAQWAVNDDTAKTFALAFYRYFLDGKTLGEATYRARLEIKSEENASWLSFVVFGDPEARLDHGAALRENESVLDAAAEQHRAGLEAWLRRNGLEWSDLKQKLSHRSQGQETWIKHIIREIAQGAYQQMPPERLPGPDHYVRYWCDKAFDDINHPTHGVVVSLLCVVEEPVNKEILKTFAGTDDQSLIEKITTMWRPFMDEKAFGIGFYKIVDPLMLHHLEVHEAGSRIAKFDESHRRIIAAIEAQNSC